MKELWDIAFAATSDAVTARRLARFQPVIQPDDQVVSIIKAMVLNAGGQAFLHDSLLTVVDDYDLIVHGQRSGQHFSTRYRR